MPIDIYFRFCFRCIILGPLLGLAPGSIYFVSTSMCSIPLHTICLSTSKHFTLRNLLFY
jgi:hypothetical protein